MAEIISRRSIVYDILFEVEAGKKSAKEAAKEIDKLAASVDKVGTEIEQFSSQTLNTVTQLRRLKQQINNFKGSEADFIKLNLQAAKLTDQLNRTNDRIRVLASSTKNIDALAQGFSGIVGVMTAAQGAAALFGSENKNLQQAILRTQGALALLQGTQQAVRLITEQSAVKVVFLTQAQKAYNFVVGTSTGVLKGFKLALAATGIGLALIVVSKLAESWGLFGDNVDESNSSLDDTKIILQDVIDKIKETDSLLGTTSFNKLFETLDKQREKIIKDWMISDEERTKQLKENDKQRDELATEFAKFINERAKKSALDRKEFEVLITKEGTAERLEAEIAFINAQRDIDLKQWGLTQDQKLLITQKALVREMDLRRKFLEDLKKLEAKPIESEQLSASDAMKVIFDEIEASEKKRNELLELQGAEIKYAEVHTTATDNLIENDKRRRESQELLLSSAHSLFGSLQSLLAENQKAALGFAIADILTSQAVSMANAIKSVKQAVTPFDYIAGIAATVAATVATFAQVFTILNQAKSATSGIGGGQVNVSAFAEGEVDIHRPGEKRGKDSIPAMIMPGESVMTTEETARYKPILEAIRGGTLEDLIHQNYIEPSLAVNALEHVKNDSTELDYSERFYRQLLATGEGNSFHKKEIAYLASIDKKLSGGIPDKYR